MNDEVRELLEQDALDFPDGHPCRVCDQLYKDHPNHQCEEWS